MRKKSLNQINKTIINCKKCPRLASYIRQVAKEKVKRFQSEKYWGKPVPGLGDATAELLLVGLAPAAHGGNRTGRMFTGDGSADWVAKVLYHHGFASKPTSDKVNDGFELIDTYITAAVRCAPPDNKPTKTEFENCSSFLRDEFFALNKVKVIICLGKIAFDSCCKLLEIKGQKFSHGKSFTHGQYTIICSYHPSRQNTQTGRLKWQDWNKVFAKARRILNKS